VLVKVSLGSSTRLQGRFVNAVISSAWHPQRSRPCGADLISLAASYQMIQSVRVFFARRMHSIASVVDCRAMRCGGVNA